MNACRAGMAGPDAGPEELRALGHPSRTAGSMLSRRRRLAPLLVSLAVWAAPHASHAATYTFTAPDGTIHYTNAPSKERGATSVHARTAVMSLRPLDALSSAIHAAATRYRMSERLVRAIITVESGFDPNAVSKSGAQGLMQLMPETAAILGVQNAFDPIENVQAGVRHLRGMMTLFREDLLLALAAYHAGPSVVASYQAFPPYPETREYVSHVLQLAGVRFQRMRNGIFRLTTRDGVVTYTNVPPTALK
jgi:soluble lytic murein transglycosylase-like protein